jgi:hypothetical protein
MNLIDGITLDAGTPRTTKQEYYLQVNSIKLSQSRRKSEIVKYLIVLLFQEGNRIKDLGHKHLLKKCGHKPFQVQECRAVNELPENVNSSSHLHVAVAI